MLGLTDEDRAIALEALDALGFEIATVRERVAERLSPGEAAPEGHIPFAPPAKRVLELTLREALKLGHNYIGTEHIILALLEEPNGVAGQVLRDLGVDYEQLREKEIELIRELIARRKSAS